MYRVETISERTTPARTPSVLVGAGRSLWSPECLDYAALLLEQPRAGELDDGMILQHMLDTGDPVHGVHIAGRRYDISTPDGYTAACGRFGKEPVLSLPKEPVLSLSKERTTWAYQ